MDGMGPHRGCTRRSGRANRSPCRGHSGTFCYRNGDERDGFLKGRKIILGKEQNADTATVAG